MAAAAHQNADSLKKELDQLKKKLKEEEKEKTKPKPKGREGRIFFTDPPWLCLVIFLLFYP
jgi:hypothetical protein